MDQLAHLEQMGHWDHLVLLVTLDPAAIKALRDHLDLREFQDQEEIQVQ